MKETPSCSSHKEAPAASKPRSPRGPSTARLLAGRRRPIHPETDRVLVRTAANIVGTIFRTANVLEAARRKDDFLAILGHELRNPLAPIMTAVELLARNPSAARETKHHRPARSTQDSAGRRPSRHLARHPRPRRGCGGYVSLNSVLERAAEERGTSGEPQPARAHRRAADDITLLGDPVRLAQIFGNLLQPTRPSSPPRRNASTSWSSAVLVESRSPSVTTAVGSRADSSDRIFEPFVQADRERNTLQGGLGLGLGDRPQPGPAAWRFNRGSKRGSNPSAAFTVDLPTVVQTEQPKESVSATAVRCASRRPRPGRSLTKSTSPSCSPRRWKTKASRRRSPTTPSRPRSPGGGPSCRPSVSSTSACAISTATSLAPWILRRVLSRARRRSRRPAMASPRIGCAQRMPASTGHLVKPVSVARSGCSFWTSIRLHQAILQRLTLARGRLAITMSPRCTPAPSRSLTA